MMPCFIAVAMFLIIAFAVAGGALVNHD